MQWARAFAASRGERKVPEGAAARLTPGADRADLRRS